MSMCKAIFLGELVKQCETKGDFTRFEIKTTRTDEKKGVHYSDVNSIIIPTDILARFEKPYVGRFGYFEGTLREMSRGQHHIVAEIGQELTLKQVEASQEAMPFHV